MSSLRSVAGGVLGALALFTIAAAPARGDKCTGAKLKAVGKKESGLLGCSSKEPPPSGRSRSDRARSPSRRSSPPSPARWSTTIGPTGGRGRQARILPRPGHPGPLPLLGDSFFRSVPTVATARACRVLNLCHLPPCCTRARLHIVRAASLSTSPTPES